MTDKGALHCIHGVDIDPPNDCHYCKAENAVKCHRCGTELDPFNSLDVNEHGDIYCHTCKDWCLAGETV